MVNFDILWIAEKPSVAKDLAKAVSKSNVQFVDGFLYDGTNVFTNAVGHLLELVKPEAYDPKFEKWVFGDLPCVPQRFKLTAAYKRGPQLALVGKLIKQAKLIMHCGDAGREGQMIVDELLEYFNYRGKCNRVWMTEMNSNGIRKAVAAAQPNHLKSQLYAAAKARSEADWLVGMNLTRGYTLMHQMNGNKGTIHIGRVQTPTLCLIVQREIDRANFVPTTHHSLGVVLNAAGTDFKAKFMVPDKSPLLDDEGRLVDRAGLQKIAQDLKAGVAHVDDVSQTPATQLQPLPYNLGNLQKDADSALGLSPAETLKIAQQLYEEFKLSTYPRTDYTHMPESEHAMAQGFVDAAMSNYSNSQWPYPWFTPDYTIKSRAWNDSLIGDHHGLRPTDRKNFDITTLPAKVRAVYEMILQRYLMQFAPPHRSTKTVANFTAYGHKLRATGSVEIDRGWRRFIDEAIAKREQTKATTAKRSSKATDDEEDDDDDAQLPNLKQGDQCNIVSSTIANLVTKPPPLFTAKLLLDAMENAHRYVSNEALRKSIQTGIGTAATRAAIIDKLVNDEYVTLAKEGKSKVYRPTDRGMLVYELVPDMLRRPDLTAYFEHVLQQVEQGKTTADAFLKQQLQMIERILTEISPEAVT